MFNHVIYFQTATKEGYLLKQTWTFQRWKRRYFKLKGHKLYYAKVPEVSTNIQKKTFFSLSFKNRIVLNYQANLDFLKIEHIKIIHDNILIISDSIASGS